MHLCARSAMPREACCGSTFEVWQVGWRSLVANCNSLCSGQQSRSYGKRLQCVSVPSRWTVVMSVPDVLLEAPLTQGLWGLQVQ